MIKYAPFAFVALIITTAYAGSGVVIGGGAAKEKLMNGDSLNFEDRLEILRYIESLEQPIAVGTGSDTVVIQRGQVFRLGEKKVEENHVLKGDSVKDIIP